MEHKWGKRGLNLIFGSFHLLRRDPLHDQVTSVALPIGMVNIGGKQNLCLIGRDGHCVQANAPVNVILDRHVFEVVGHRDISFHTGRDVETHVELIGESIGSPDQVVG
jgi:hypothetical protein